MTPLNNREEIKENLPNFKEEQIRICLLNIQSLPREQRREHNKMIMKCLLEVHNSKKEEALIWMKWNIDEAICKIILADFNYDNKCFEKMEDWVEDVRLKFKFYFESIKSECNLCIQFIQARFNINSTTISNIKLCTIAKRLLLVTVSYMDLIKDTTLLATIVYLLQGTPLTHFTTFSSQVCWLLAASIVIPLVFSALETARHRPLLILGFHSWKLCKHSPPSRKRLSFIKFLNVFFYPLVPALLIHTMDEANQNAKDLVKKGNEQGGITEDDIDEVGQVYEYLKEAKMAFLTFKRNEFGVEMVLQLTIQNVMLLLATTVSPTHTGLEAVFKENFESRNTLQGFTVVFLFGSILWSFLTSARTYVKIKSKNNDFLSITGNLILGFRALFTSITRVFCIVAFFCPFLGLFDILAHWAAEQMSLDLSFRGGGVQGVEIVPPIQIATDEFSYKDRNTMKTESVAFSLLYRSDYTDPTHPVPPGYQEYTGVTLGVSFMIFCILLIIQYVSIIVVKYKLAGEKFKEASKSQKLQHAMETLNMPDLYMDWDQEDGSPKEHRERYGAVKKEMLAMVGVHFLFNLALLCPIFVTGNCN